MIVVDECVSNEKLKKVLIYLRCENIDENKILDLKKCYSGIPDSEIMKHLINEQYILITSDRVLHNKVKISGKRSVYIDNNGKITKNTLDGVKITPKNIQEKSTKLKENYKLEKTDIHEQVLPDSQHQLKKYRTKRRRIRNHFEGIENIEKVDVTLSKKEKDNKVLIGVQIRVIANNGMKALDASENYILENDASLKNIEEIYFSYVLIILLRLMLNTKKTTIYYDKNNITRNFKDNTEYSEMFKKIKGYFYELEFVSVNEGKQIEKVRRKLEQLVKVDAGNEIITEEINSFKENNA